ncbi:MAG TPA: hypothetical protein PLC09_10270, partial [Holophaga sp.]|nr:hypothetical protein [Holophaga sp.]
LETLAPDAEAAWEAADGDEAHRLMVEDPVDVLFLDILFPPEGAFALLERVRATVGRLPKIIFVTSQQDQAL